MGTPEPNEPHKIGHPWNPVEIWRREWPIVRASPTASVCCFAAGCGLVLFLFSFFILPGKDATIQSLQTKLGESQNLAPITNTIFLTTTNFAEHPRWVIRVLNVILHTTGANTPGPALAYKILIHVNGQLYTIPSHATVIQDRFPPVEGFEIADNSTFRINFDADLYNTDADLLVPYKTLSGEDQIIRADDLPTLCTNELVQTVRPNPYGYTKFDLIYQITKE